MCRLYSGTEVGAYIYLCKLHENYQSFFLSKHSGCSYLTPFGFVCQPCYLFLIFRPNFSFLFLVLFQPFQFSWNLMAERSYNLSFQNLLWQIFFEIEPLLAQNFFLNLLDQHLIHFLKFILTYEKYFKL